jgi:hypothetical protein
MEAATAMYLWHRLMTRPIMIDWYKRVIHMYKVNYLSHASVYAYTYTVHTIVDKKLNSCDNF